MCKKIWIQTYFGPVTVDSVEIFCHFAFWRDGLSVATLFIALENCIFWGASFELITNLATLNLEKLQGFHGTPYTIATPYNVRGGSAASEDCVSQTWQKPAPYSIYHMHWI